MRIKVKSMHIENFKGIKCLDAEFGDKTIVRGKNASGKTTLADAMLWLLFDKNSNYASDFEIRPLNEDGTVVNFVDIVVSAVFDIDGKETELKKVQKQNWVKHRGSEEAIFQGNVNSYEQDGYAKSLTDFKAYVNSLVSENMFKIITNPTYFPNMKWKEQREMLLKFVATEKDVDIAKRIGGFDEILDELEKAPSTDDIMKKFAKIKKELETKQIELPIRIDELTKQKTDETLESLDAEKNRLNALLVPLDSDDEISALQTRIMESHFAISKIEQTANAEVNAKRVELNDKYTNLLEQKSTLLSVKASMDAELASNNAIVTRDTDEIDRLHKAYDDFSNRKFDESKYTYDEKSDICPVCKQKLPADRIEAHKAELVKAREDAYAVFVNEVNSSKKKIVDTANALHDKMEKMNLRSRELLEEEKKVEADMAKVKDDLDAVAEEIKSLPSSADVTTLPEVVKLNSDIEHCEARIGEINTNRMSAHFKNQNVYTELKKLEERYAMLANNDKIDTRIAEIKSELKDVAQKIATAEKVIYLTESFVKAKLENITSKVNGKFKIVTFKLFDILNNGGMNECCECCVNGVPYSDINSASKIQAGLDIINTLSENYDVYAPIFIDNRESCTFIPDMEAQTISLYVDADCDKLTFNFE